MKKARINSIVNSFLVGNKAVLILVVLVIALSAMSPIFLTTRNLLNVLRQVCVSTILACGFTMVLGSGHIDLSVGSLVGLSGIMMAMMMKAGVPIYLAILISIVITAMLDGINAYFIMKFHLSAFIVTLATQQIFRGACYLLTGMLPITYLPQKFSVIGQGYWLGIPIPVYIMFFMVILVWIIMNRTKFGKYILAIGGNMNSAHVCGINVNAMRFGVYLVNGAIVAIAAVVLTARAASAQPTGGLNMEMDSIAAVVIGGTSMNGGSVRVFGTLLGCLIVGIVNNGLNLLGIDSNWQTVAKGVMILLAVILDSVSTSLFYKAKKVNKDV